MSNLYVAEATVTLRLGSRATPLLDRDGDGAADTGLLAAIIESTGKEINLHLRNRYGSSVPFNEITDTPTATPEGIQVLALRWVLWDIYAWHEPDGPDATLQNNFVEAALAKLLIGEADIDVDRAKAHEGQTMVTETHSDPIFAGLDSSGADRLRGV